MLYPKKSLNTLSFSLYFMEKRGLGIIAIIIIVAVVIIGIVIVFSLRDRLQLAPVPPKYADIAYYILTVNKLGNGQGTVTSVPAGINCGSDCSNNYTDGKTVQLTASPFSGSVFSGWSGACSGSGICAVLMNANKNVAASFVLNQTNQSLPDLDIINMLVNVVANSTNSTNITTAYVYVTVKNIGSSTAGQSRTQVDVNPSYTPRNILTPSLAPNAQITISDDYTNIVPGNYSVTAYADILFQINESNENNNGHGPVNFAV